MDSRQPVVQTHVAALEAANSAGKANSISTSSVYSASPAQDRPPAQLGSPNGSRNGSRHGSRHHYTPSYMSHVASPSNETLTIRSTESQNNSSGSKPVLAPLSKPTSDENDDPSIASVAPGFARGPSGLLLVLVADQPHPSTIFYIEMLLNRHSFTGILFAANKSQEAALKQLKIDVYALIGRLRKELVVSVHLKHEWGETEIGGVVSDATQHADGVQGVLCCPTYDEGVACERDVIDLECEELDRSWRTSVAYLHASLKATVIHLLAKCKPSRSTTNGSIAGASQGPFFLVAGSRTTTSAASQITKSASDTLLNQFERATQSKGLTMGFAEDLLIPEPTREPPSMIGDGPELQIETQGMDSAADGFVPLESPTKLWSSWALNNDLEFVAD